MTSNVLRLKRYKTMFADGRSSVTADAQKNRALVAVFVGDEPLSLSPEAEMVDVEDMLLRIAKRLRLLRKQYGRPETYEEARYRVDKAVNIAYQEYEKANAKVHK